MLKLTVGPRIVDSFSDKQTSNDEGSNGLEGMELRRFDGPERLGRLSLGIFLAFWGNYIFCLSISEHPLPNAIVLARLEPPKRAVLITYDVSNRLMLVDIFATASYVRETIRFARSTWICITLVL